MTRKITTTSAWLLEYSNNQFVAVSVYALKELLIDYQLKTIPFAASYCNQLVEWQEKLVPVMDLNLLINGIATNNAELVIVSFDKDSTIYFGGLCLVNKPKLIDVCDDQYCQIPESLTSWQNITCSCFLHYGANIPIIELDTLFLTANLEEFLLNK